MTKVLLVDDSALARRNLRHILSTAGCDVIEANDGMAALESYYVEKPDVVFLDLVMRGMYGLEVLQKLRELDPHARVVIVTADVQTSSHQLAAASGAGAFITKPVDASDVLQALNTVMDR
jgi:two-component system, chemotaxis family, chemotaxis protein CheY